MSQNPMTSSRNGEENPGRTLFEMFASELPSVEVTQGNCTRVEWDGRTPYGQVGSDEVLRSTRTELTQENPPPQRPQDIEMPRQSSSNPEKVTNRKRTIERMMVADKVLPSGEIVREIKQKTNKEKKMERRGRGAAGPATSKLESSQAWYGLDETHPDFLDQLLAAQEHSKEGKSN